CSSQPGSRSDDSLRRFMDKPDSEISPLAYLNANFLNSPSARVLRILSEYLEPAERLRRARIHDTIVFFGSARSLSPEDATRQVVQVNEQIERGGISTELKDAKAHAEIAVRLARYYQDAVELSRRMTEWSNA